MSVMIEIYYRSPEDSTREKHISSIIEIHTGRLTHKEIEHIGSICMTAEFDTWEQAQAASAALRQTGEHVEGPAQFGAE